MIQIPCKYTVYSTEKPISTSCIIKLSGEEVKNMSKKNAPSKYLGLYEELAEIVGEQHVKEIYDRFQGQEVSFPMRLFTPEYVVDSVLTDTDKDLRELAREYGYNEKYLKRLISQRKREMEKISAT